MVFPCSVMRGSVGCLFLLLACFLSPLSVAADFSIYSQISSLEIEKTLTVTASISGLKKKTKYYLQAAFTKSLDSPHYFGLTKNTNGEWYAYKSSPKESDLASTFFWFETDEDGNSSTVVEIKPDYHDPDYKGPGEYGIRLKRYTEGGSGYWSDNTIILVLQGPDLSSTPVPTMKPSPTLKPSIVPTLVKTVVVPSFLPSPKPFITMLRQELTPIATEKKQPTQILSRVLGKSAQEAKSEEITPISEAVTRVESASNRAGSLLIVIGGFLLLGSAIFFHRVSREKKVDIMTG